MILGCLITTIVLIFVIIILAFVGVTVTFGLLAKILIPIALIAIGIDIVKKNRI